MATYSLRKKKKSIYIYTYVYLYREKYFNYIKDIRWVYIIGNIFYNDKNIPH